jgi:ABC-2 type transport system ATP-binding protein
MIAIDHLTKRYGSQLAVDDVSFRCEPGTVTGFLGPNGAGKSTTLRMVCGLTPPTAGSATVLGARYRELDNPGRRVGVLLDASAQHAGRTGREVLTVSAQILGVPRARVDELLERVGLSRAAARKRVGAYSLGMRQRLGIAHALIGDPQVLILDELPMASTPRASSGCAACCATSPTARAPCCSPRTCCARSRRSPTS